MSRCSLNPCRSIAPSRKRSTVSLLLISLLFVCGTNPLVSAQETKSAAPHRDVLNAAMQKFVQQGDSSGIVTLVGHKGSIVHLGAVGVADIASGKPMQTDSAFAIASMTKPVVGTALMILQDEGKLSVDDEVAKYIPGFADVKLRNGDAVSRAITIRDCVTHSAGLAGPQIFKGSLKDAVENLATRPLAFQPGTRWQYSPGMNVAGRIIEIVSKEPLDRFIQTRIFDPLKMKSTSFFPESDLIAKVATLYGPGEEQGTLKPASGFLGDDLAKIQAPNPSGGLISTAEDMYRFYQMVLNGGELKGKRILSEQAVKQMTSPQTGDLKTGFTPGNCWGLSWCITREPQDVTGMLSPGTFGHGGAFGTQGWVDPVTKSIYVLMIQRVGLGNSDGSQMRKTFQQVASDQLVHGTR